MSIITIFTINFTVSIHCISKISHFYILSSTNIFRTSCLCFDHYFVHGCFVFVVVFVVVVESAVIVTLFASNIIFNLQKTKEKHFQLLLSKVAIVVVFVVVLVVVVVVVVVVFFSKKVAIDIIVCIVTCIYLRCQKLKRYYE